MPEKYPVVLKNITNNGASNTTIIKPPLGPRYFEIFLEHGYTGGTNTIAAAYANITEVRVIVNSTVRRRCTGTELRAMNVKYGTKYDSVTGEVPNTAPGVTIPIIFAEDCREDKVEIESLALPTNTLENFSIEIDFGAATAPSLVATAWIDFVGLEDGASPRMVTWTKQQWPAAALSLDITDISKKGRLLEINFTAPTIANTGVISKLTVFRTPKGGKETNIYEMTAAMNKRFLQGKGVTAVAGSYYAIFDADGLTSSGIDLDSTNDFTMKLEFSDTASGNASAIIERIETV